MGQARKFGAFHLYLILFGFFGSEVNVCSEETVVGEFEVRYPIRNRVYNYRDIYTISASRLLSLIFVLGVRQGEVTM